MAAEGFDEVKVNGVANVPHDARLACKQMVSLIDLALLDMFDADSGTERLLPRQIEPEPRALNQRLIVEGDGVNQSASRRARAIATDGLNCDDEAAVGRSRRHGCNLGECIAAQDCKKHR